MIRFYFVLSFLVSSINPLFADTNTCSQHSCMAVVDAGSSGSRLHIYSYDLDAHQSPVHIQEIWSKKVKPGLSTIPMDSTTVSNYLKALFVDAPASNLPLYFYATAGMRLLPQPKQQKYYQFVQQWFATQGQWSLQEAKTITGKEEGTFGWLAVNFQTGNLDSADKKPVGVMDVGGASVQIVFPIADTTNVNPDDEVSFQLYGRSFNLFVHSFLGLGENQVSNQFLDYSKCFPNDYLLPNGKPAQGSAVDCAHAISTLVNEVHAVKQIVHPALEANLVEKWYAIGGLSSLASDPLFNFSDYSFTSESLFQLGDTKICHQPWQELSASYPNNEYLYGYCLFTSYAYSLLVEGYGLLPNQTIHYLSPQQPADWTMGVVLHPHQA